jgi:redox-sensitive bicupin YhaK (pirin superfamily)
MITARPADARGRFDHGWLRTAHTFSFGEYDDPAHRSFRALRVLNDDVVAPGAGFPTHPHRDMEILTYILSGALRHQDSSGGGGVIRPGEVQRMSAGRGIRHSEFNASSTEPVHLLQVWITPDRPGHEPSYEQRAFPIHREHNRLFLVASPDGADGSTTIHQDARVYAGIVEPGASVRLPVAAGRHAWVHVARGRARLNGSHSLVGGDGAALTAESEVRLDADETAEVLVFDLP